MYFEIENVNSFDPDAEAAITLSGAMGQEESRNLSENIQWGIQRKFEEGLFSSYKHFMGYRCVEGELVIVPEQAEIVRLIFELYLKGYTFSQIKKTLGGKWCKNGNRQNGMECKCNPADAKE